MCICWISSHVHSLLYLYLYHPHNELVFPQTTISSSNGIDSNKYDSINSLAMVETLIISLCNIASSTPPKLLLLLFQYRGLLWQLPVHYIIQSFSLSLGNYKSTCAAVAVADMWQCNEEHTRVDLQRNNNNNMRIWSMMIRKLLTLVVWALRDT